MRPHARSLLPPLLAVGLALTGCGLEPEPVGETQTLSRAIDLDQAEMLRLDLHMAAGEVELRGGADKLMRGEFLFNVPRLRPDVRYDRSGFRGRLTVRQPRNALPIGPDIKNEWHLALNDTLPLDAAIHLGAGKSTLDLRTLALRTVEVHMGVGELELDVSGRYARDVRVEVHGGIGEARIRVPREMGVIADLHGGIGSIRAPGLRQQGSDYRNEAANAPGPKLRLSVHGGIGEIQLQ